MPPWLSRSTRSTVIPGSAINACRTPLMIERSDPGMPPWPLHAFSPNRPLRSGTAGACAMFCATAGGGDALPELHPITTRKKLQRPNAATVRSMQELWFVWVAGLQDGSGREIDGHDQIGVRDDVERVERRTGRHRA